MASAYCVGTGLQIGFGEMAGANNGGTLILERQKDGGRKIRAKTTRLKAKKSKNRESGKWKHPKKLKSEDGRWPWMQVPVSLRLAISFAGKYSKKLKSGF
jgi:hypothetical protein